MNATCEIVKALKRRHSRFLDFRDDARRANNEKLAALWQDRADVVSGVLKFDATSSQYRLAMGIGVSLCFDSSAVQSVTVRDTLLTIEL